jgi:hypothetical protein
MTMMRFMRVARSAFLIGLVTTFASGTALAQNDAINGTWKLNPSKSKFDPGPGPKSQTIVISGTDTSRKVVVDLAPQTGNAVHWEVAGAPGAELPVVGTNPNADHYVFKRLNATTLEAQYLRAGKPTIKQTAVVSADGKTLTVTGTGTDAQGRTVNNVAVYDK